MKINYALARINEMTLNGLTLTPLEKNPDNLNHRSDDTETAVKAGLSVERSVNKDWLRALEMTAPIGKAPQRILPVAFDEIALKHENAPALISRAETYSFRELAEQSLRYARWGLAQGLTKGDVVALIMENRAEYVAIWLGLNRIGVVVALLNTNLSGDALAHCLVATAPQLMISSSGFADRCKAIATRGAPLIVHDPVFVGELERFSTDPLVLDTDAAPLLSDHALYIFTSGTTGLPKAAVVSHRRVLSWALWFGGLANITEADRMYNCLPLYHSVGGVVAVWAPLLAGGSVVLRERFSVRSFWNDIVTNRCTLFQYIGELCRYLTNAPPSEAETHHQLRMALGNGLRPEVWGPFQERFHIPRILEFYAATESNFSLYNVEGERGAIGRIPSFLASQQRLRIIRIDQDTEAPLRGADGFCQICGTDEAGETIAQIAVRSTETAFEGYLDPHASERKVLRNVFADGDAWMRSGDLMRKDARGFFYFVDRIGDTFRWKGENVATAEVAATIAACPGIIDVAVYGVAVPGHDGRIGMATVVTDEGFDLAALRAHVEARLPAYARPAFIRLSSGLDMTDTFKHRKRDLVDQGFDPRRTDDAIYFAAQSASAYQRLDAELYEQIICGTVVL
jgi:fatty-acyl-CoA synthase